jgi:hypothetical protein
MDEYGVSPLSMMRLLSPVFIIGPIILWLLVMGPFVLYLVARWRANRDPAGDPQLGLKVAFHYFGLLGFQFALAGTMLVVWAIVGKWGSSGRGDAARFGFGLLIPALIVYFTHLSLLRRTNDDRVRIARRLFGGYNLLVVGMIGFTALMLVFNALFQKGSSGDFGRFSASLLIVYGTAWAVCGFRFANLTFDTPFDTGSPPLDAGSPPIGQGPTAPGVPAGPTLPALGGGSFPPIEPK